MPEIESLQYDTEDFQRLALELTDYGLTINHAKLYVFLLGRYSLPVRVIATELGLHRVDVYRKLHELEDFGLVELYLGSPKRYSAVDPSSAMSSLIDKFEIRVSKLKLSSSVLKSKLIVYQNLRKKLEAGLASTKSEALSKDRSYKLVTGRKNYYDEIKRLVRNSKFDILRIVSANGLKRTFSSGLYKEYVRAKSRGVSLRMISEVDRRNLGDAKRLSRVLSLRHMDGVHLRFVAVDRSIVILSARFDENNMSLKSSSDSYLLLNDMNFAEATCFFFEHLWRVATDWVDVRQKLESSSKS